MKSILLIFPLLTGFFTLFAQNDMELFKTLPNLSERDEDWIFLMYSEDPNVFEVDRLYNEYYSVNKFTKNIHTQNYKHWRWQVDLLLNEVGLIRKKTKDQEDFLSRKLKQRLLVRNESKNRLATPDWECIGPFETYFSNNSEPVSWHKNIYAMDQSDSNPDVLISGTEAGGVYKSIDKGMNWTLITKNEVFMQGNTAVKIHPTDTDFFLVSSNNRIYRSLDGGISWSEVYYMGGSGYEFRFDPSNNQVIYCPGSEGLFKSTDGGSTWAQIFTDKCWDIDFHPTNSSIIYLLKSNLAMKRSELFRSDNGGNSWTLKDNGYYVPADLPEATERGGKIGLTPAEADYVYVCLIGESKANDDGWIGIYKSTNKGDNWINPAGQDGGPYGAINSDDPWNVAAYDGGYHQGFFNFDLEVSDVDANKLWIATIRLSESTDGGATFRSIGAANSTRLNDIHADVQDLEVNGSDIWVASDGGLNYSNDELMSHTSRKRGIQASHFWGFNTGWNQDTYTGGRYHDGTIGWYENYPDGTVFHIGGVEEASGYVHPVEGRKQYFRTHYASSNTSVKTIPDQITGNTISHPSLPLYPNESYYSSSSSGIYFDPRYADHLFIGRDNILYKSTDGGANFTPLYTFPSGSVFEFEQSRDNYDVMYIVFKPSSTSSREIYLSTDGGLTFDQTLNVPGNRTKIEITLNPENASEIWVGLGNGSNGSKVYRSIDSGHNWINMTSSSLDNESIMDIRFQGGTTDLVYLATYNNVFYYDATSQDWIDYGDGLPLIAKSLKLNPFYRDAELRLGSSGRGVFACTMADTLFQPVAQAITYKDTVFCVMDTVQFDCYSMLKHEGASWNWSFNPEPTFINDPELRNPRVVFGSTGSYDVTLSVTDANSNTDVNSIPGMVFVDNRCEPDTIPGQMLQMSDNNDFAQTPNFGIDQVDTLTITAWVKPNGIQDDYTGIVMNDDNTAGFNFANGNNTLRYHWPGGSWSWNSGLIVEADKWSHVAMVATDNAMKLYVNGVESVHNVNLNPADITSMKIGSYKGWSSRNMRGMIDEVCIWTRALSQEEIQNLRHLTKEDTINDPSFLAYYQFNENTLDPAIDRTGNGYNASLMNGAERTLSNAPVGGGRSQRLTINAIGSYDFSDVGLKIKYLQNATFPNGDLVVSRLNILPDVEPQGFRRMYQNYYWVINNYGSNVSFSEPDSIWFSDLNFIYEDPSFIYLLSKRGDNDFSNNWQSSGQQEHAQNGVPSKLTYDTPNGLIGALQYHITFRSQYEDIVWNGMNWRGGSGIESSPSLTDTDKDVHIMPGLDAILLENANCKNLNLFEGARFIVPGNLNLQTQ